MLMIVQLLDQNEHPICNNISLVVKIDSTLKGLTATLSYDLFDFSNPTTAVTSTSTFIQGISNEPPTSVQAGLTSPIISA